MFHSISGTPLLNKLKSAPTPGCRSSVLPHPLPTRIRDGLESGVKNGSCKDLVRHPVHFTVLGPVLRVKTIQQFSFWQGSNIHIFVSWTSWAFRWVGRTPLPKFLLSTPSPYPPLSPGEGSDNRMPTGAPRAGRMLVPVPLESETLNVGVWPRSTLDPIGRHHLYRENLESKLRSVTRP